MAADDADDADGRLVAGGGLLKTGSNSLRLSSSLLADGKAQERQRNEEVNNVTSTKRTEQVDVVLKS